jgi:hypothetical protein
LNPLQQACNQALKELGGKYPHLVSDPDENDNENSYLDGQSSTANVSSVGTPLAAGSNNVHGSTKLKLTFNANTNGSASGGGGTTTGGTNSGVVSDEEEEEEEEEE